MQSHLCVVTLTGRGVLPKAYLCFSPAIHINHGIHVQLVAFNPRNELDSFLTFGLLNRNPNFLGHPGISDVQKMSRKWREMPDYWNIEISIVAMPSYKLTKT